MQNADRDQKAANGQNQNLARSKNDEGLPDRGDREGRFITERYTSRPASAYTSGSVFTGDRVAPPGRQPGLRVNRLQARDPQPSLDPLAVHRVPVPGQPPGDPPAPVERAGRVRLVDPPHQGQVLGRLPGRLPVVGRPTQADQLALPADAQLGVPGVDQGPPLVSRTGPLFIPPSRVRP